MSNNCVFDFLNSIQENKKDLIETGEYPEQDYNPYLINRFLSSNIDTILYAQEMNRNWHLSKKMQYDYLRESIRSKKRKCSWGKKIKIENVDHIKLYFNCSTREALIHLEVLSEEDINKIKVICNGIK
jgi:hypothetical protein